MKKPFAEAEIEAILKSIVSRTGLSPENAKRLFEARDRPAKRNPLLQYQWVKSLDQLCSALIAGGCEPIGLYETVFWIRLYGVITELRESFAPLAEADTAAVQDGKAIPFLARCAKVFATSTEVRGALSDEELVYAAFLRHVHAHVTQDSFELGLMGGKKKSAGQKQCLRSNQTIPTLGRHVPIEEVHKIVDQIQIAFNYDGGAIARSFAAKVAPAVSRLMDAMGALERTRIVEEAKWDTLLKPGTPSE